jgi:DeoR/GlpR family transcriptional regulator of sugar metabolism
MQAAPIPSDLYLEERRQAILDVIVCAGRVTVGDLAEQFGVSAVTIRGDLDALAGRNLVVRTHGGAVPAQEGLGELALALRRQRQVKEKSRIGEAAAETIADGDAIYLDASSTSLAIAHHLRQRRHITVLSNSLAVAQELLDAPAVTVVLVGGVLQKETASCIGVYGLDLLDHFNLQIGFFGAHGLTVQNGLTDIHPAVAEFKRRLAQRCRRVTVVLDGTKWARVGVASFARIDEIDAVITDASAPAHLIDEVRSFGVAVTIV